MRLQDGCDLQVRCAGGQSAGVPCTSIDCPLVQLRLPFFSPFGRRDRAVDMSFFKSRPLVPVGDDLQCEGNVKHHDAAAVV